MVKVKTNILDSSCHQYQCWCKECPKVFNKASFPLQTWYDNIWPSICHYLTCKYRGTVVNLLDSPDNASPPFSALSVPEKGSLIEAYTSDSY